MDENERLMLEYRGELLALMAGLRVLIRELYPKEQSEFRALYEAEIAAIQKMLQSEANGRELRKGLDEMAKQIVAARAKPMH